MPEPPRRPAFATERRGVFGALPRIEVLADVLGLGAGEDVAGAGLREPRCQHGLGPRSERVVNQFATLGGLVLAGEEDPQPRRDLDRAALDAERAAADDLARRHGANF